jgi:hypothetical protein
MTKTPRPAPKKSRARAIVAQAVTTRLSGDVISSLDGWALWQGVTRAVAARQLIELGLSVKPQRQGAHKGAARASEMAGAEIDRIHDLSASHEDRAARKRRLTEGPKEFRDARRDRRSKAR